MKILFIQFKPLKNYYSLYKIFWLKALSFSVDESMLLHFTDDNLDRNNTIIFALLIIVESVFIPSRSKCQTLFNCSSILWPNLHKPSFLKDSLFFFFILGRIKKRDLIILSCFCHQKTFEEKIAIIKNFESIIKTIISSSVNKLQNCFQNLYKLNYSFD